jgi:hypothetical protein
VTAFETNNSSKVSFFTFVTLKINFSGGSDEFFIKPDDAESFLSAARTALTNNQVTSSSRVEVSDELQKLGTLFTQGILDEQEFKAAKAKLLGL